MTRAGLLYRVAKKVPDQWNSGPLKSMNGTKFFGWIFCLLEVIKIQAERAWTKSVYYRTHATKTHS